MAKDREAAAGTLSVSHGLYRPCNTMIHPSAQQTLVVLFSNFIVRENNGTSLNMLKTVIMFNLARKISLRALKI